MTARIQTLITGGLVGAMLLFHAAALQAQCNVPQEMDRALAQIERAREVVGQAGVPEARELLRSALLRLDEARGALRRGDRDRACRLIHVAQGLAFRAIELSRRRDGGLEKLEGALRQTDEYLERITGLVAHCDREPARRALETAFRQQEEARRAFASPRFPLAIQLTRMAREGAERARRLCQRERGPMESEVLSRQLERTDELLERAAQTLLEGDGEADPRHEEQLDAARRRQGEAWHHLEANRLVPAWAATRQARFLIARALGTWTGGPEADRVARLIDGTATLINTLREAAEGADRERALSLLDRAERRLDDARRALAEGRAPEALVAARAASALSLDVAEMLEGSRRD